MNNNVTLDFRNNKVTYGQLDDLLLELGFVRRQGKPGLFWYEHADSGTAINLKDKSRSEVARPSEVASARVHLVAKGLIGEEEIDRILGNGPPRKATPATEREKR